jgi:hypothetical protein
MEDLEMRNAFILLSVLGVFALAATAQTQKTSKSSDEQQLQAIEAETGEFERQNDWSKMDLLADDWISPGATKVLSKRISRRTLNRILQATEMLQVLTL